MGVARSITTSHSSSEDPYLLDDRYEWDSGRRPRRLPRTPTPSESSFVAANEDEDTDEGDGDWVSREECEHARRMAVALEGQDTRIMELEHQLLNSQELDQSTQTLNDMMGERIADLTCNYIETGMDLTTAKDLVKMLVMVVVVLFGIAVALFLAR